MPHQNISQSVAHSIKQFPDQTAIWARGKSVTYLEFGDRAMAIATPLRRNGIARGDRIAVLSTYVALNPRFPSARNNAILRESGASALLVDGRCSHAWECKGESHERLAAKRTR